MRVVVASYPRCGSILLTRAIAGVKSGPTWNDLADRFPDIFKTHRPYSDELVKEYDRGVYIFGDPVLAVISAAARLHRGHPGPKVKAMLECAVPWNEVDLFRRDDFNYDRVFDIWTRPKAFPTLCLRYERLWDNVGVLSEFLGREISLPPKRERRTRTNMVSDEDLTNILATYKVLMDKVRAMPDVRKL